MYKIKIPIGDWSYDGHGKTQDYIIETNYPVHELQQAYKESVNRLGISFDDGNHDNPILKSLKWSDKERDLRHIAVEYEENRLSKLAANVLLDAGINVTEYFEDDDDKESEYLGYIDKDLFVNLLLDFIALSLPKDFTYKIVSDNIPVLNGYWDKNLNVHFGYGLFY